MFRLCSDFSVNVQNAQNLFRHCSECSDSVQSLFSPCSESSESVQNFQLMFRICSEFSVNVQNVQTFSEFLAQKLVYSELLDFVVIVYRNS